MITTCSTVIFSFFARTRSWRIPRTIGLLLSVGLEQERQAAIGSLIELRFGAADAETQAIIPALMNLSTEEYTRLLWQLTREELLQQFSQPR